ncbi:hypothetical protein Cob_v004944 [Colletotrichum orbiculare MAFF 240422]|uniref:Uncharacterized protein n=1 Tax=Colletotrichum orbiculare (strain 104-T / ATCC 96160 / CBS 514.97 / LARS 414 / MAFF 240422) TaxID=1213857 RepID=N4VYS2_COLOR|nr:hypothetical protein Cob_v004944 [Colletotrichum orbiculare MAFF 240422]
MKGTFIFILLAGVATALALPLEDQLVKPSAGKHGDETSGPKIFYRTGTTSVPVDKDGIPARVISGTPGSIPVPVLKGEHEDYNDPNLGLDIHSRVRASKRESPKDADRIDVVSRESDSEEARPTATIPRRVTLTEETKALFSSAMAIYKERVDWAVPNYHHKRSEGEETHVDEPESRYSSVQIFE